jgi:hypothetical protein
MELVEPVVNTTVVIQTAPLLKVRITRPMKDPSMCDEIVKQMYSHYYELEVL